MTVDIGEQYAVQMRNITKLFGSNIALRDVNLDVKRGSIHSILGENGAGKSTLMNVLYGLHNATDGDIYINGKKEAITNPNDAIDLGIGMVHQHFMLVEEFSILENIILGVEETNKVGRINFDNAIEKVDKIIQEYGFDINPSDIVADVTVGTQQKVEIIKALYRDAEILILDEPTAVLTPQEIDDLLLIMKKLVKDGKSIIIITHKLDEIKRSSQQCTVLRRGEYIDTVDVCDYSEQELADMMVGGHVNLNVRKDKANYGDKILEIDNLTVKDDRGINVVDDLSLYVRAGEVYGIAGIDGNGQKELVEVITGLKKCQTGKVKVNGNDITNHCPKNVIENKVGTIHEDRQTHGLILDFPVYENAILDKFQDSEYTKRGILDKSKALETAHKYITEYDIRPEDCAMKPAGTLSGGNQQKIIIARAIDSNPDLLIAMQPTRGLDVGAIEFIYNQIIKARDSGIAVLLVSFELDEIMELSDTIGVIYNGKIQKTYDASCVDERTLGLVMAGGQAYE